MTDVQIIEPQNQSVLVCSLELHFDSLKAHITKHMTQGSCMLEPPIVSYLEIIMQTCKHTWTIQNKFTFIHIHL